MFQRNSVVSMRMKKLAGQMTRVIQVEEISFWQYCENENKAYLLQECRLPENGSFHPEKTGYASHKVLWWMCSNGHKWQSSISTRTYKGKNCPYCANKKVLPGYNDLQTLCMEVAKEWHPIKNGELKPTDVICGSDKLIWWQCKLGHEWQSSVRSL